MGLWRISNNFIMPFRVKSVSYLALLTTNISDCCDELKFNQTGWTTLKIKHKLWQMKWFDLLHHPLKMKRFSNWEKKIDNFMIWYEFASMSLINWKKSRETNLIWSGQFASTFFHAERIIIYLCAHHQAGTGQNAGGDNDSRALSPLLLSDDFLMIFICVPRARTAQPWSLVLLFFRIHNSAP